MRRTFFYLGILISAIAGCAGVNFPSQENNSKNFSLLLDRLQAGYPLPQPVFELEDPGVPGPVDYLRYGKIRDAGTARYQYVIEDLAGLKKAVGAGIYPNQDAARVCPFYKEMQRRDIPDGAYWDYLKNGDLHTAFYLWTQAPEDPGIKTFFTGVVLEKAGHVLPAIKAYHAAIVHFPKSVCWSEDGSFVWYIAQAAMYHIQRLCRDYPSLNLDYAGAKVEITNGQDTDLTNDVIVVAPGWIIHKTLAEKKADLPRLDKMKIVQTRGRGQVRLVKFANGHWQMRLDGQPFFIRAVSYHPTEIGLGPHNDRRFFDKWMFTDKNNNGKIDAAYDAWVDKNKNGQQDSDEPAIGDFQLMKEAGINAIRFIVPNRTDTEYDPALINKPLLRDLFTNYGIRLILYDFLGAYTLGSGATWQAGTDYTDSEQRKRMKDIVRAKVLDLKDEPFVLMWVLGNENNLPVDYMGINASRTNAAVYPKEYAEFLNEVAKMIHVLDPDHPVAAGNAETGLLEYYNKYAPALDIAGINSYRGKEGFGELWLEAKAKFDRPILITEYGCDAYYQGKGEDEQGQYEYHLGNLRDIVFHQAGGPYTGNAIGGIIFEYLDEWWKDTFGHPEDIQQTEPQALYPFPDGFDHEEWFGLISQGSGKNSPFERCLRKAYYLY